MTTTSTRPGPAVVASMFCSAALTAQLVGGKAARDALFLAQMGVTSLPAMVLATSVVSIALVILSSKLISRMSPGRFVPAAFALSAVLFVAEWALTSSTPRPVSVLVYLHMSGLGPVLASGFWLLASESFDPRTAKQRFGQIAGAGTLGGIVGGVVAGWTGTIFGLTAVLLFLAVLNLIGGAAVWQLARTAAHPGSRAALPPSRSIGPESMQSGLKVFREVPQIRNLAALVMLGTMSAAFVDYVFKAQAVGAFGRGDRLLQFFAIYYAVTSVVTFIVQAFSSRFLLKHLTISRATSLPSVAVLAGTGLSLLLPSIKSIVGVRGGETVFRGSLFRYGYEVFYTPIPAKQKRSIKSIIDVGFDRLGDAVGAGIIRLVLFTAPMWAWAPDKILLWLCLAASAVTVVIASRLNRDYIDLIEQALITGAEIDPSDVEEPMTRTTILKTLPPSDKRLEPTRTGSPTPPPPPKTPAPLDPLVQQIASLRSGERDSVLKVLRRDDLLPPGLVPHVVPLLAWNPVAADAAAALRNVAERHIGLLTDVLVDPDQDFAIRRRLARVFAVCSSQRAADSLMMGLQDLRFEVRFQCGRSLSAMMDRNPRLLVERDRVVQVILKEMAVSRPVWEGQKLLDALEPGDEGGFVDELVRDRASQSLSHVFTLLSFVLPKEPLLIAFRGLHSGDQNRRGTALEYLEGVLPAEVRQRLWPFLEDNRRVAPPSGPRDEILAAVLKGNQSIMVNLAELKQHTAAARAAAILVTNWRQRTRIAELPAECRPDDRAAGYAIQAEVVRAAGQPIVGWKIAATSAAGQAHIGVDGPLAGPLLRDRVLPEGAAVELDGNIMKVAEAEFCFRFGRALPKREHAYTEDEVLAAVDALHMAIEVPDSRYHDFARVGAPQLIADTACACWFVLGKATTVPWRERDLVAHEVTAYKNGQPAGSGSGANVLGDPRIAVTWLANEVRTFAGGIEAGQIVTTGTCVVPVAIAPGDALRMDFGEFGTVEARIT